MPNVALDVGRAQEAHREAPRYRRKSDNSDKTAPPKAAVKVADLQDRRRLSEEDGQQLVAQGLQEEDEEV